jgi:hypothetical protein
MEILKINKSQIYFTEEKNSKKFRLKVSSNYDNVLKVLKQYDKKNLIEKLITKKQHNREFNDIDFREMPTYDTTTSLLDNVELEINYTNDDIIKKILEKLNNPKITKCGNSISCWYPERNSDLYTLSRMDCISTTEIKPKYPIYIISLGRWEKRRTVKYLEKCNIDYKIVVEPSEYDNYASVINPNKILVCPEDFSKQGKGGIPVRNFVWEHSIKQGALKHWILDDNIERYYRNNKCQNSEMFSGAVFKIVEDYTDRYENVKMSGHQYLSYCPEGKIRPPFTFNTRIFSSILLSNDIYPKYKWEGRYNEDVDLSIRLQKDGYVNILCNFIICDKETTMKDKGGNTNTIYSVEDAHLKKAQELQKKHPDCVSVVPHKTRKFHHKVDFSNFQNKLKMKDNLILEDKTNEYTLKYVKQEGKMRRTNKIIKTEIIEEPKEEIIEEEIIEEEIIEEEKEEIIEEEKSEIEKLREENQKLKDENYHLKSLLKHYLK